MKYGTLSIYATIPKLVNIIEWEIGSIEWVLTSITTSYHIYTKNPATRNVEDRVLVNEFISDPANYNPSLKAFFSGNVKVKVFGGLDYTIHDDSMPVGWKKCCKGVFNRPRIFTTTFTSPEGTTISSQNKLDRYFAIHNEQGLSKSYFDFKSTITFPKSATILKKTARRRKPLPEAHHKPITLDLLGIPPKNACTGRTVLIKAKDGGES